jgi:hypothetical protein
VTVLGIGAALAGSACATPSDDGDSSNQDITAGQGGALQTLNELAAFGEKRVGTPEGAKAAQYVMDRMNKAGLVNVHFEEFNFPMHIADVPSSSFEVTNGGKPIPKIAFDVFEGSGNGRVEQAPIMYVGAAKPEDLAGKDLHGKIAFVKRDSTYHRSSQYRNVAQAGALAMLYESAVPGNEIQIGSIREAWEPMGPIPTITVGSDDGDKLRCLVGAGAFNIGNLFDPSKCAAGTDVRATIDVKAKTAHGTGRNVVGFVPGVNFGKVDANGQSLDHQIVFGAHYDTWYVGSADNGCGVAALLGLAEARAKPATPQPYTLVFVGYDGEEVGLYGGYDYLRKHQNEGMLSVVNFEIPAAVSEIPTGGFDILVAGVATSKVAVIQEALLGSFAIGPLSPFAIDIDLNTVAKTFGGIIPTDIQGAYRSGIPTISTASDTPWYHTRKDTPDKVDTKAVAQTVTVFSRTTDKLLQHRVEDFKSIDFSLWTAHLEVTTQGGSTPQAVVDVTLADSSGKTLPDTNVTGTFFCDDFFAAPDVVAKTDSDGKATFTFEKELANCAGRRWVHVTAGPDFPLVEKAIAVPTN